MALSEVAMEAAAKAGTMGALAHVQAKLFEAEMHRQQGESDQSLKILRALEQETGEDPELITPLSETYERYGYQADALRLVEKAYDLTKSQKLLEKLIELMEAEQQYDKAFALWRQLWESATEPMAVVQAQDRLLDIGSRNGKLADIAIELEERLDEGKLSDRELTMLLDIYTSVNDPVSAADVLHELSSQKGGDKIAIYQRMVQVYMECELFGRCSTVLRKLIKLDPGEPRQLPPDPRAHLAGAQKRGRRRGHPGGNFLPHRRRHAARQLFGQRPEHGRQARGSRPRLPPRPRRQSRRSRDLAAVGKLAGRHRRENQAQPARRATHRRHPETTGRRHVQRPAGGVRRRRPVHRGARRPAQCPRPAPGAAGRPAPGQ